MVEEKEEANEFAAELLIPPKKRREFVQAEVFTC